MPVTTRSGRSYDLTASTSAAERQSHRRAARCMQNRESTLLAVEPEGRPRRGLENGVTIRAEARARRTSEAQATERSDNTSRS